MKSGSFLALPKVGSDKAGFNSRDLKGFAFLKQYVNTERAETFMNEEGADIATRYRVTTPMLMSQKIVF